jgi:hypothetical protein
MGDKTMTELLKPKPKPKYYADLALKAAQARELDRQIKKLTKIFEREKKELKQIMTDSNSTEIVDITGCPIITWGWTEKEVYNKDLFDGRYTGLQTAIKGAYPDLYASLMQNALGRADFKIER